MIPQFVHDSTLNLFLLQQPTVIQEVETFKKQQSLLPYPCPVIPLVVSEPEITVQEEEQQQRL